MVEYIVAVGSNIDPDINVQRAFKLIKKVDRNTKIATLLKTKAVGFTDQADFINTAFAFSCHYSPSELKVQLLAIEAQLNRVRTSNKNGPRTIDLDIVMVNGDVVDDDYYKYDFVRHCVDELINV